MLGRRTLLGAAAATAGAIAWETIPGAGSAEAAGIKKVSASVDLGKVIVRTSPTAVGIACTTFGRTPITPGASVQAASEARLDARYVRVPLAFRNGWISSSAGGNSGSVDGKRLVNWYRNHGMRVLGVIGGRTNDVNFAPSDPATIIKGLGHAGIDYCAPNEPALAGWTPDQQIAAAKYIWSVGAKTNKNFKIWGPTWTNYAPDEIARFARAFANSKDRDKFAGLTYHHYAMGETSLSTPASMKATTLFRDEVTTLRKYLKSLGLPQQVNIDELNYSWRFRDGTAPNGRNNRFYTSVNTVWCALSLGTILAAGGRGMIYGTQNGALGLTVEAGPFAKGRTPGSPMPAYWGVAAWTGAHQFPHFANAMFATATNDPDVTVFAVNNEAGGQNLVCINRSTSARKSLSVSLKRGKPGTHDIWATRPDRPFDPYVRKVKGARHTNSVALVLPAMSVSVVVLRPRRRAPSIG